MGTVRDLHDFLEEAELLHYYSSLCNQLKITTVPQLKYVEEDDLIGIGMTKPEMRRLKKMYKKECPHGALGRLKKAILTRSDGTGRTLSPSPPEQRTRPMSSYISSPSKQIIPVDSISVSKTLGEGEFGVVQQAIWTTERGEKVQVALKCLSKERIQSGTQEFLKEAGIMQTIDHENVVRMFGVVIDKADSLILVTELAPMKSLLECLKDPSLRLDFPIPRLCDFSQQICDGMSYLESKRLIHRDLAARNILVFSKTKVKISDFGLSRALGVGKDYYQSKYSVNLKLPIAWCAPECINYLKFTSASDVWAYGVALWEMFMYGAQPWAGLNGQEILEAVDTPACQRLERPELCPKEYYDLMLKCWYHDPQKRPTFSEMYILLPQMRPTQVKAVREFPEVTVPHGYLYYRTNDIIVVLDKSPEKPPVPGFWKGVLHNGKSGFFDPVNCAPFIEPRQSPASPSSKTSLTRKESKRSSARKQLRVDMISGPQNDLRHTGHIGYDGAVFGDVSFIGDNYDKLPLKVASTGKLNEMNSTSSFSLQRSSPDRDGNVSINGTLGHSWISQESIDSTFLTKSDEVDNMNTEYHDIDDDSIFADFKMPDISSSFDFGPSFMDEVLKALNEKEAKLEASSDSTSTPSREEPGKSIFDDRSRSISPSVHGEVKQTPPPLPSQPPRSDSKREPPRPEPRKQAKVKPMSASDEKMMEDAIAMANEFATFNTKSHMISDSQSPPLSPNGDRMRSDSDSESESPRLIQKIKNSIKRSPKIERKRTFSEEIQNKSELEEDVPPEAQEAYNMLVVRGSVKEKSRFMEESFEKSFNQDRESPIRQDLNRSQRESPRRGVPLANTEEVFLEHQMEESKPVPKPRVDIKRSEIPVPAPKPRPEIIQRVEPVPRPQQPPPSVPSAVAYDLKVDLPEDRVNGKDNKFRYSGNSTTSSETEESKSQIEVLRIDLPDSNEFKRDSETDNSSKSSQSEEIHKPDMRKDSTTKSDLFGEDFSEPSPREIMSKLARESRIRRSLDHQRGVLGDGPDLAPSRNLREPQGIPGKGFSSTNGEDEEVDTNPLRMLRGGAIPIRGGRVGQGTNSNSSSVRFPKLRVNIPALHHSMSVDSGTSHVEHAKEGDDARLNNRNDCNSSSQCFDIPPPVPARSCSVSGSSRSDNPVPLPPRKPLRQSTLNGPLRVRKHPLLLDDDPGHTSSAQSSLNSPTTSNVAWSTNSNSTQVKHEQTPDPPPPVPPPPRTKSVAQEVVSNVDDDDVFEPDSSDPPPVNQRNSPPPPNKLPSHLKLDLSSSSNVSKAATFPRGKFRLQNVKCNLEQLGFYNHHDPFWDTSLSVDGRNLSNRGSSEEISPLMLANYKSSDGVSYEDLLDFALDREKNCPEVETLLKVFCNEVSVQDCVTALEDTKWNLLSAIKYIKLKQLLSIQLGDIKPCKDALMKCDWDVKRAANFMLAQTSNPPSPECVDV